MKITSTLLLLSVALILVACGGGVPADVFPQTVGAFTLQAPPSLLKDPKGNKMYHGTYKSGDKRAICNATEFASPNDAIASVRGLNIVALDGETKPVGGENGGYRILGYMPLKTANEKRRIWVLTWSRGTRAYECDDEDGDESDNAATLRDLEKAWQAAGK
ncbi:MAG: hypothetical protein JO053_08760 [Acidobacteria bacterium]|nr:hypothetical protein [Acidobacteriota bacterium]